MVGRWGGCSHFVQKFDHIVYLQRALCPLR